MIELIDYIFHEKTNASIANLIIISSVKLQTHIIVLISILSTLALLRTDLPQLLLHIHQVDRWQCGRRKPIIPVTRSTLALIPFGKVDAIIHRLLHNFARYAMVLAHVHGEILELVQRGDLREIVLGQVQHGKVRFHCLKHPPIDVRDVIVGHIQAGQLHVLRERVV